MTNPTPDCVPDADALSLTIGSAIPTTFDPALRDAWRDERVRIYFDRYPDSPMDGATVYVGHDTHDVLHACGASCARAIVAELDGEFVDAGLNAYLDVAGPADAAATVDVRSAAPRGDADLGNDDEAPCARSGCNGVIVRSDVMLDRLGDPEETWN